MIATIQVIALGSLPHITNTEISPLHVTVIHIATNRFLPKIYPPHARFLPGHHTLEMTEIMLLRIHHSIDPMALNHHIIIHENLDQFPAKLHLLVSLMLTTTTTTTREIDETSGIENMTGIEIERVEGTHIQIHDVLILILHSDTHHIPIPRQVLQGMDHKNIPTLTSMMTDQRELLG